MLNNLKKSIRENQNREFVTEATIKHTTDDDIRDIFLNDDLMDGAEDDPEITKLIDKIPEYGDAEDIDLATLEEQYIPEGKI